MVVAAAFGPYLIPGFRTEQLAVYGTLLVSLPFLGPRIRFGTAYVVVLGIWIVSLAFVTINAGRFAVTSGPYQAGATLAGIENYCYPVAVLLLVAVWTSGGYDRAALLVVVCRTLIAALCVNSLVAAAQMFMDLTPVLQRFWDGGSGSGQSVAQLAFGNGRLSGVFNQPTEAGVAYSLGLFAAVYLFASAERDRPLRLGLAVLLLVTGGVLCVSKVFLLLGIPLALWQLGRQGRLLRRLAVICTVLGVSFLVVLRAGLSRWQGGWMLRALLPNDDDKDLLTRYSAQRFGQEGVLKIGWNLVLDTHPWLGYGAGGLTLPYDSSWIEAVVVGGLVGVALLGLIVVVLVGTWWRGRSAQPSSERPFAGAVVTLAVMATAGVPTFTVNRAGLLLWIFLALLVLSRDHNGDRHGTPAPAPAPAPAPEPAPAPAPEPTLVSANRSLKVTI